MIFSGSRRTILFRRLLWVLLAALPWMDAPAQARARGARAGSAGVRATYNEDGVQHKLSYDPELNWTLKPGFAHDVYIFARLMYGSGYGRMANGRERTGSGGGWTTDTPDADFNLAFRLHQMTSLKVRPGETDVAIRPDVLAKFPFVYAVEPGRLVFSNQDAEVMRQYLLTGGFFMLDDDWGDDEINNIREQLAKVFPHNPMVELELTHPIFHNVFDLRKKPQTPAIPWYTGYMGYAPGLHYEPNKPYVQESHEAHYFGIFDDKGRMMVFVSHNCDLGDGWEREGENIEYFKNFSEPQAYPMMINVVFYAMTH